MSRQVSGIGSFQTTTSVRVPHLHAAELAQDEVANGVPNLVTVVMGQPEVRPRRHVPAGNGRHPPFDPNDPVPALN